MAKSKPTNTPSGPRKGAGRKADRRRPSTVIAGYLFLAPALIFYAVFELWPIIQTAWYSFYDWNGIDASTFIGIDNYIKVFTDPKLIGSIGHAFFLIIFFSR